MACIISAAIQSSLMHLPLRVLHFYKKKGRQLMYTGSRNETGRVDDEYLRLLQKMIEKQERSVRVTRIVAAAECILLTIMLAAVVILGPRVLGTVKNVDSAMEEVDDLIVDVEKSLTKVTTLAEDADALVVDNETAVNEAIGHFNEVDFESLNKSIARLSEVLKPLADFAELFE